jgi:hypothetical protein
VTDPEIDITRAEMPELHELFALANSVFADRPEWDADHVLRALARDVVFVAQERSLPAGYVACSPSARARFSSSRCSSPHRASAFRVVVEEDNLAARSLHRQLGFCPLEQELFELVLPLSA